MTVALEIVLHELFRTRVPSLVPPAPVIDDQIGFQPPDDTWRTFFSNLGGSRKALNVYLVDLRENRKLRTNEPDRTLVNGTWLESPPPPRVDCHYLISAWSPDQDPVQRTKDEHGLLAEVTFALMNNQPLVPSAVFIPPATLPGSFPANLVDAQLPGVVLPPEGFPKYAEFWGTMGGQVHPWKPAVYFVVTMPVALPTVETGYMVTTRTTDYHQRDLTATAEVWIQIGGHVLDTTSVPPTPIVGAWVRLETPAGVLVRQTETNGLGRFTFERLRAGSYQLRAGARGLGVKLRNVDVPTETGEYDLRFP